MYEIPKSMASPCEGYGPDHFYQQHKVVCWAMTKHTGRHGCKRCLNEPENRLAIQITRDNLQKIEDKPALLAVLPPTVEPLDGTYRITTGEQLYWKIKVPCDQKALQS